jgi:hypothetical protein
MGYRALLKQYIRHLLKVAGDHHIHIAEASSILSRRDVAELKLLAAEIDREDGAARRIGGAAIEADAASLAAGGPTARATPYSAGVVSAAASAAGASAADAASAGAVSAGMASAGIVSAGTASAGAAAAGATSAAGAAGAGAAVSAPL